MHVECQHSPDHRSMHEVVCETTEVSTLELAPDEFASAGNKLQSLALEPIETWVAKGR